MAMLTKQLKYTLKCYKSTQRYVGNAKDIRGKSNLVKIKFTHINAFLILHVLMLQNSFYANRSIKNKTFINIFRTIKLCVF